jgi:hypothetical protein
VADPPETGPDRPDQRIRASRLNTGKAQGESQNPIFEHQKMVEAGFARIEAALPSLADGPQYETSELLVSSSARSAAVKPATVSGTQRARFTEVLGAHGC